jgi:hypothetical protein
VLRGFFINNPLANQNLNFNFSANISQFQNAIRSVQADLRGTERISNLVTSQMSGIFGTAALVGFGKAVLDATSQYQKFSAVLGNTLGSSALANLKLKELQDFAAKTPFSVNELTGSFVKLANAGFKPTGDQMTKLGDLASSTGKSFDQLAEAILDAQSGEFERLKEFGVRAKDAGDSVIFTYKGVQTQVEKTSGSIRDYITSLGAAEGVSGSMAKISETLGGKVSNLGDSWDQMLISVGNNTSGVFNSAITVMSKAINKLTQYNEELSLVEKYQLGNNGGGFLEQLNRAINPFASKGATKTELAVQGVKDAQENVRKFIGTALQASKTTADFGKALAGLKKQGDIELRSPAIGSEKERAAIRDVYQQGVKALQDARTNFAKPTADGNFGTGKKGKEVKTVSDILADLEVGLKQVDAGFQTTFDEKSSSKIGEYQKAIEELIKIGINPLSASIQNLKKLQLNNLQLPTIGSTPSVAAATANQFDSKGNAYVKDGKPVDAKIDKKRATDSFATVTDAQKKIFNQTEKFNEDFNNLVQSGLGSGIADAFSSIGEAFASGGDVMESFGKSILKSFSGFLSSFGDLLIKYGTAAVLKGKLDIATAIPGAGIGAGIAAIAAGAALKLAAGAFAGLLNGNKGSSGGKTKSGGKETAFANGGIVSGKLTNATLGEYNSSSKGNPEIVAPLNKLRALLPDSNNNGAGLYEFKISGDSLVAVLDAYDKRQRRGR